MMRAAKYLLIVILLLVFVSGCSNGSVIVEPTTKSAKKPAATTSTPQPSKTLSITPSATPTASEFPPSDWPETPIVTYSENDGKIFYQEGITSDRWWTPEGLENTNAKVPTKDEPAIPDKETAVAVATAIFHVNKIVKNFDPDSNMEARGVFYDTQDEVWMVGFSDPPVSGIAQGELTIVLRKDNAQVLAIWSEAG